MSGSNLFVSVAANNGTRFSDSLQKDGIIYTADNLQRILIGTGAQSTLNVGSNDVKVTANILPTANEVYDIGSSNMRFRDIYLSGNTINLGGATISKTSEGSVSLGSAEGVPARLIVREIQMGTESVGSNANIVLLTQNPDTGDIRIRKARAAEASNVLTPTNSNIIDTPDTLVNNLFEVNGLIGVGTSNPTAELDVVGSIAFTGSLLQNGVPFTSGSTLSGLVVDRLVVASNSNDVYSPSGMVWDSTNQRLGIGLSNPLFPLHVSGSAVSGSNNVSIFATHDIAAFSDARCKTDLKVIPDALNKVAQLNGYTFDRIPSTGKRMAGVIAQEVQAVLPEVVNVDENGYLSVAYGNMVALLIEAVKELKAEVQALKQQAQ